jgi:phosphate transport system substrate-binding protein
MRLSILLLCLVVLLGGCTTKEPGSTRLTEGQLVIQCDEAVYPVMQKLVAEFVDQYRDAKIDLRCVEARDGIANFVNDSVKVIIVARAFNREELDTMSSARIDFQKYQIAMSSVAVIANLENPRLQFRLTELDSIFGGEKTRWDGRKGELIEVAVGDVNSSTNEAFRNSVMGGKRFGLTATPMRSSPDIITYVRDHRNAFGIVGMGWLRGFENRLNIVEVGGPAWRPDTTRPGGQYFAPAQAYVFQGFYPVTTPVWIYTREVSRDLGLGFISFAPSASGQKVVTKEGLVPVTMPVRLVQLTSEQVN